MIAEPPRAGPLPPDECEALFHEARSRQRRRRTIRTVSAIVVAGCISAFVALLSAGGHSGAIAGRDVASQALPAGHIVPLKTAGPLAVAPGGALYVADVAAHRVLVRLSDGRFRVIAGNGQAGFSGDRGPATGAELSVITDLAVSPAGSLYIADGGRIRVVGRDGVIRTIAGDGRPLPTTADHQPLADITAGIPALSAALGSPRQLAGGDSWLAIAFSPRGQLYISTGYQILRLTSRDTLVPVRAIVTTGLTVLRGPLRGFGPIAVDGQGNIDVSGVNGWAVWQVGPSGAATQVGSAAGARRSGGNYSVLERGPNGSVYAEDGAELLRIEGHSLKPAYTFTRPLDGEYFWLTYYALAPSGAIYADEIPGGSAFEARQQLISLSSHHETLLWEQPAGPTR